MHDKLVRLIQCSYAWVPFLDTQDQSTTISPRSEPSGPGYSPCFHRLGEQKEDQILPVSLHWGLRATRAATVGMGTFSHPDAIPEVLFIVCPHFFDVES